MLAFDAQGAAGRTCFATLRPQLDAKYGPDETDGFNRALQTPVPPPRRLTMTRTLALAASLAAVFASSLAAATLQITSTAFAANGAIPSKYTCDGQGINPPLAFGRVPARTPSLVLVADDPDVPKNLMPSGVFDHWLIWDVPATSKGFAEGEGKGGVNGTGQSGFMGPCPPDREHRYFFKLFALDTKLTGARIANKKDLETAMNGHIIEKTEAYRAVRAREIGRRRRSGWWDVRQVGRGRVGQVNRAEGSDVQANCCRRGCDVRRIYLYRGTGPPRPVGASRQAGESPTSSKTPWEIGFRATTRTSTSRAPRSSARRNSKVSASRIFRARIWPM